MKYVLLVGDGMADYPVPELGDKTPLQVAYKPNMDTLAAKGQSGLIKTVPDTLNPGSETAILSVLGYDPTLYCTGRGPLEAPARGIHLNENDAAFRCNLITEKDGLLNDYSAGHVTTAEAQKLIAAVDQAFGKPGELEFYSGLDYRHFLVLRNAPDCRLIKSTPPHDASGVAVSTVMPQAKALQTQQAAKRLQEVTLKSKTVLENHPVNLARIAAGKNPANMIWPWGGGKKPSMPLFKEKYGLAAAVISAVDLVKGIGVYAGMEVVEVPGVTGLHDTNYEGKADYALKALERSDFVFVHVEAPDEAGHVQDAQLKVKTIEDLDKRLLGRLLAGLNEPYTIAILPDHPTPITVGTHTRDPVPFTIYHPNAKPDNVTKYDETSAKNGVHKTITNQYLLPIFLSYVR
ncbi:MAG: cofactor-independent phosphoglycerate mutase [Candidatus Bathyarchaeota archaeon]|nr:cofactor-independent phosphoglycerate mutase [Candidatus Bathyarchaeota archaeon]